MKKATVITRQLDSLGRVTLPIELRRTLGIGEKDAIEIFVNGEEIVLRKYAPGCTLCGSVEQLTVGPGEKLICAHCVDLIAKNQLKLLAGTAK